MRLIWEQHAGRMTSAREGAALGPTTARLSLPVEQSPEGLHGHIGPTQGQKPEKPQQELSQPAGHEPDPHGSDQSSPSACAGLPGGFGEELPPAACSFFLNPTGDSLGSRVAALRKQLSLLLAPSPGCCPGDGSATATKRVGTSSNSPWHPLSRGNLP